ncbi:hypothetical protein R3P38DRAFT_3547466 [Favolaschia claudopus]|uniref:Uncharacterized protein n=1 Tax=Favolaschia claudopus TaxID=2862362 RepID=A0AAW0E2U0_9AGAR
MQSAGKGSLYISPPEENDGGSGEADIISSAASPQPKPNSPQRNEPAPRVPTTIKRRRNGVNGYGPSTREGAPQRANPTRNHHSDEDEDQDGASGNASLLHFSTAVLTIPTCAGPSRRRRSQRPPSPPPAPAHPATPHSNYHMHRSSATGHYMDAPASSSYLVLHPRTNEPDHHLASPPNLRQSAGEDACGSLISTPQLFTTTVNNADEQRITAPPPSQCLSSTALGRRHLLSRTPSPSLRNESPPPTISQSLDENGATGDASLLPIISLLRTLQSPHTKVGREGHRHTHTILVLGLMLQARISRSSNENDGGGGHPADPSFIPSYPISLQRTTVIKVSRRRRKQIQRRQRSADRSAASPASVPTSHSSSRAPPPPMYPTAHLRGGHGMQRPHPRAKANA